MARRMAAESWSTRWACAAIAGARAESVAAAGAFAGASALGMRVGAGAVITVIEP